MWSGEEREGAVDRVAPLFLSGKGWCVSRYSQLLRDDRPRGSGSTCHGQVDQMDQMWLQGGSTEERAVGAVPWQLHTRAEGRVIWCRLCDHVRYFLSITFECYWQPPGSFICFSIRRPQQRGWLRAEATKWLASAGVHLQRGSASSLCTVRLGPLSWLNPPGRWEIKRGWLAWHSASFPAALCSLSASRGKVRASPHKSAYVTQCGKQRGPSPSS